MRRFEDHFNDEMSRALANLDRLATLVPDLFDHASRGYPILDGPLPTSENGDDYSNDPPPHYADPTGETVANLTNVRPKHERADIEALKLVNHALIALERARRAVAARLPALDAALDGRFLTFTTYVPPSERKNWSPSSCIVCDQVAAKLRRGMCDADYMAWTRAGMPDIAVFRQARKQRAKREADHQEAVEKARAA